MLLKDSFHLTPYCEKICEHTHQKYILFLNLHTYYSTIIIHITEHTQKLEINKGEDKLLENLFYFLTKPFFAFIKE